MKRDNKNRIHRQQSWHLFNSVFYGRITPVSVSTLKPLLGVIGVLPLKPWISPILYYLFVYKTSSYTVIC